MCIVLCIWSGSDDVLIGTEWMEWYDDNVRSAHDVPTFSIDKGRERSEIVVVDHTHTQGAENKIKVEHRRMNMK